MFIQQSLEHQKMGSKTRQVLDRARLKNMRLSRYSNMILIKIPDYKKERTTKAGIILDFNPNTQYLDGPGSHMADVEKIVGIVEKVPESLYVDGDVMPWYTEIQVVPGDLVWFDYYDSLNSITFLVEEDEYRLIPYSSCYIAIRKGFDPRPDLATCLNGYCLFEEVVAPKQSELQAGLPDRMEKYKGRVFKTGKSVTYPNRIYTDDIYIRPGDVVEFRKGFAKVFLERQTYFMTLDRMLFRAQRKDIIYNHGKDV